MDTSQLRGQHLRPAQETGNEKAEPLLSIQQTSIDHSIYVLIDSSGLVMDNGNSPVGFIEDTFTRLTQRLIFEFLGGHARMQELPCLGDLADGNNVFHRTTPSPTFSKSSQFKLLDSTGHLLPSSIVFMDSDVNPRIEDYLCESVLLDSFDASSTTFISPLEHFRSKLISQPDDHTIEESHQCSPINFFGNEKIAVLLAESLCDSEVSVTQVFMKSDGFSNGIDLMSAPIPISSNQSDNEYSETPVSMMDYPKDGSNIFGLDKGVPSEIHNFSVSASNEQIQKTFALFVLNMYPFMYKNRRGSLPIELPPVTASIYDGSTMNNNAADKKDLGNSVSSFHLDQVVQTSNNSTSDWDSVSSMDCTLLGHRCNDKFGDSNKFANISMDESIQKFSFPDPKHLNEFLYGNLQFPRFLPSELLDEKLDMFDYPSLHEDSNSIDDEDVADLSDNKSNNQFNGGVFSYDKKTLDTSGVLVGLENGSSSGDYKEIEISGPCYTEPLDMHWPTGVDSSSFDVSNHEELLESYGLNNQDEYNDIDYTCESPIWPGKMDVPWNEVNRMKLTDLASNEDSLGCSYDETSQTSVPLSHHTQRKCALNTSSLDSSEDYLSQGHLSDDEFENSMGETISGTTENPLVYAISDPNTLNDYLYGNVKFPMFLASELMITNFDRHGSPSFSRIYCSDDCADVASSSDKCNVELLDSDSSIKDTSAFPYEFSVH